MNEAKKRMSGADILRSNLYKIQKTHKDAMDKINQLPKEYTYHTIHHIRDVVIQSERIAKKEKINKEDIADLKLAAWLHDVGYIWEPSRHEARGAEYATTVLNAMDFPAQKINKITGMILATKIPQSPKNILEQIICDADLDYLGREGYAENSILLLHELRLKKEVSELEWLKIQDSFLSKHSYFTKTSNTTRNKLKAEVLASIKNKLKK
jgi:predicted metal-dependent HD superfamily phosphohydrolase